MTGHPRNTEVDDSYSTSPARDPLFCELCDDMLLCSREQIRGCNNCRVQDRCAGWLDTRTGIDAGYFTPNKLARCRAEFAVIRVGKNGHNGGNGETHSTTA